MNQVYYFFSPVYYSLWEVQKLFLTEFKAFLLLITQLIWVTLNLTWEAHFAVVNLIMICFVIRTVFVNFQIYHFQFQYGLDYEQTLEHFLFGFTFKHSFNQLDSKYGSIKVSLFIKSFPLVLICNPIFLNYFYLSKCLLHDCLFYGHFLFILIQLRNLF